MRKNNFLSVEKVVELGGGGVSAAEGGVLARVRCFSLLIGISDEIEAATIAMFEATFVAH